MAEAEEATATLLNDDSEDEVDPSLVVNEDDLYPLEVAAKAARTHGSTVPQVKYPSNEMIRVCFHQGKVRVYFVQEVHVQSFFQLLHTNRCIFCLRRWRRMRSVRTSRVPRSA